MLSGFDWTDECVYIQAHTTPYLSHSQMRSTSPMALPICAMAHSIRVIASLISVTRGTTSNVASTNDQLQFGRCDRHFNATTIVIIQLASHTQPNDSIATREILPEFCAFWRPQADDFGRNGGKQTSLQREEGCVQWTVEDTFISFVAAEIAVGAQVLLQLEQLQQV